MIKSFKLCPMHIILPLSPSYVGKAAPIIGYNNRMQKKDMDIHADRVIQMKTKIPHDLSLTKSMLCVIIPPIVSKCSPFTYDVSHEPLSRVPDQCSSLPDPCPSIIIFPESSQIQAQILSITPPITRSPNQATPSSALGGWKRHIDCVNKAHRNINTASCPWNSHARDWKDKCCIIQSRPL